ncbi:MAG: hypothetical protein HW405_928, partial [Candidatus Berkelbacteria bacterium]|nr:hypothetical protein [Candidatus Berkelbacteria bacterium]
MKKSSFFKLNIRLKIILVVLLLLVLTGAFLLANKFHIFADVTPQAGGLCKYLISMDRNGYVSPTDLSNKLSSIEAQSKMPYNGLVFRIPAAESLMAAGNTIDLPTVEGQLAPLRNMANKPSKLKHNFVRVLLKFPGDFFDADVEWTRIANNFAVLSQGLANLRSAGFGVDGIAFDNEGPYSGAACAGGMWNYPSSGDVVQSCITHPEKTLVDYQNRSRVRGKQVLDKILSSSTFQDIKILTYLDSYYSCSSSTEPYFSHNFEMLGSFTLGMLESTKDKTAKIIDGGEYSYNAAGDQSAFIRRYNYRKSGMPNTATGCPFIRNAESGASQYPDFHTYWEQTISVAHGLYNDVQNPGDTPVYAHPQTSDNIRDAVHYSLENSDEYVWFYTEDVNTLDHTATNYITDRWNDPIWDARTIDIPNDLSCDLA